MGDPVPSVDKGVTQRPSGLPSTPTGAQRPIVAPNATLSDVSALREDIQKDLFLLPVDRRSSLPLVEEHANIIYRRKTCTRDNRDTSTKKYPINSGGKSEDTEGSKRPPKRTKRGQMGHSGPFRQAKDRSKDKGKGIACLNAERPPISGLLAHNPRKTRMVLRKPRRRPRLSKRPQLPRQEKGRSGRTILLPYRPSFPNSGDSGSWHPLGSHVHCADPTTNCHSDSPIL